MFESWPVLALAPPSRRGLRAIPLFRIFGIEVSLDPSWILILALLLFSFSAFLTREHPDLPTLHLWAGAIVATLLFFASLLSHELAHSLVARAKGVEVDGITLFIFGGISRLRGEVQRPYDEFQVAGVGPLTSAGLGGLFFAAHFLLPARSLGGTIAGQLAYLNVILALFNLLPGFPLDGGRMFRAIAWGITGNLRKATRWAAGAGTLLAWGLIAWGASLALALGQVAQGVWTALIGWFLLNSSRTSVAQARLNETLGRLPVARAMRTDWGRAEPGENLRDLIERRLLPDPSRPFVVEDGGGVKGLLSASDVLGFPPEKWGEYRVEDVMVPFDPTRSVGPGDTLRHALEKMEALQAGELAVVDAGALLGILLREDLLRLAGLHVRFESAAERRRGAA